MKNKSIQGLALGLGAVMGLGFISPAIAAGGHRFEFGAPGKSAEADRSITITLADNYYDPEMITVRPGETIRFVLNNKGEFEHEFSINTAAANTAHRKEMAAMTEMDHSTMDHSKMDMPMPPAMRHDDPNMVMLQPGETKELIWKFTKAMLIEFACNIPGHYESGMQGKIDFGK